MPVYTYKCRICDFECTQVQKFSEKPLTCCPECHASTMERVLQVTAIIFKGSGWYAVDHRSSSGRTRGSTGKKPGPKALHIG
jgi:putative FmdB family regulatory protein